MSTIAIPIFRGRVSPVFDACIQVLFIELDQNREVGRSQICVEGLSLYERSAVLHRLQVSTVICGGITDVFYKMLVNKKIRLIEGISGEIEKVINAFFCGQLDNPFFFMPGYKAKI